MGSYLIDLEPPWNELHSGDLISFQANMIIHDPLGVKHLVKTTLSQRFLVIRGCLPNHPCFSFLNCQVIQTDPRWDIDVTVGFALGFPTPSTDIHSKAVEVCAGAGFLGEGLLACGIHVQASNDLQEQLCAFQTRQGQKNVCAGDIGEPAVIASLHHASGQPALITGGFSCQPWSPLGDRKGLMDARASSLVKILKAGHWLKTRSIILECVCAAGQDEQVKMLIQDFCSQTGWRVTSGDLQLEALLPAKRARWWCVLTDASVPPFCIRSLPVLQPQPTLVEMLPILPGWDLSDVQQISLDRYETNKFMEFGGLFENILRGDQPVRTALHGWANQLVGCPCGCRKYPFSEERLRSKGIFGALFQLQGEFHTYQGDLPMTRHMHPWEMCWIHGANPNRTWTPNIRLGIAAAGQMATPVQSCWVAAQMQSAIAKVDGVQILPEQVLWNHLQAVFAAATITQPAITSHETFRAFAKRLYQCLYLSAQANAGPAMPIGASEETTNSQRQGRKDPQSQKEKSAQEPEGQKQPAEETPELPPPMSFQAMPRDFPTAPGPAPPLQTPTASVPMKTSSPAEGCSLPSHHEYLGRPSVFSTALDQAQPAEIQGLPGPSVAKPALDKGPPSPRSHESAVHNASDSGLATCLFVGDRSNREPVLPNGASEEQLNSQRKGRQNPPRDVEKNTKEPSGQKQPAVETQELPPPMSVQAKPSVLPTARGPSPCPMPLHAQSLPTGLDHSGEISAAEASRANTEIIQGKESAAKAMHASLFGPQNKSHGKGSTSVGPVNHAKGFVRGCQPGIHQHGTPPGHQATHSCQGGIAAFATRPSQSHAVGPNLEEQSIHSIKHHDKPDGAKVAPGPGRSSVVLTFAEAVTEQGTDSCMSAQAKLGESSEPCKPGGAPAPIAIDADPGSEDQSGVPKTQIESGAMLAESDTFTQQVEGNIDEIKRMEHDHAPHSFIHKHIVQIFHDEFAHPFNIQVDPEATVGSITVAESALCTITQPVCVSSCMGTPIKLADKTSPVQQLFLHEHGKYQPGVEGQLPRAISCHTKMTRLQVLYNQEAWVASDEMNFYLHMINTTGAVMVGPAGIIPQHYEDDELDNLLQQWFAKILPVNDHHGKIISALFVAHHWFPVVITLLRLDRC